MPKMPSTPKAVVPAQADNTSKEELREVLLQRLFDFNKPFYDRSGPTDAIAEFNDLEERYFAAGGTGADLAKRRAEKRARGEDERREKYRQLIADGKFLIVPPCPQYFKNDAGCDWENAWFEYTIRLTFLRREHRSITERRDVA